MGSVVTELSNQVNSVITRIKSVVQLDAKWTQGSVAEDLFCQSVSGTTQFVEMESGKW